MCKLNDFIFIDANKIKDIKGNKDVVITEATIHSKKGIRVSFSQDAVRRLGQGVERVTFAIHPQYRNRLYVFDVKKTPEHNGYKLSKSGTRRCVRIDARNYDFDLIKTIGLYQLERDADNLLFISLNSKI